MNATVYLFGRFNSGYTQYPDDYTSGIFNKFHENAKSTTQVVIHRDGNLMYYGYIRKLEQERYIGLCVVLNGLLLTRIDGLFSLYENIISGLVAKGQLIHFNEQGDIVTKVEKLYMNKEEVDLLNESLRAGFNRFESNVTVLPALSYGVSKHSVKDFAVADDLDEIIKSSHTNGYTFIYKSKGFNTAQMNSYKGVLTRINNEKKDLQERLEKLQIEHAKTLRQKKQFKFVLVLFVVLSGCAVGLFFLNDNLNITRDALSSANETISVQMDSLNKQGIRISNLHGENCGLKQNLQTEQTQRVKAEKNFETLKKKISERQSFIIKKTSFDFRSGYLNFDYYGMTKETAKIIIRVYNDNGFSFYASSNVSIEPGDNSASVYVSNNIDNGNWYSFEILKGNIILGGGRH
ncbi:MAG: hypothetical protein J6B92_08720 [Paraprevotella sp.]|nr:hypothetical protein [Paraprevotella sp.]